jgi:uncharacterized transporter YbjL
MKPRLLHTGSEILTAPAFLQLLTSRLAPKEVAELERENAALERLTGPREVRLRDREADVEEGELAEVDLLEPDGLIVTRLRAEGERVAPSPPCDGED